MTVIAINAAEITLELTIPGDAGPANVVFGVDGSTLLSAASIQSALDAVLVNTPGFRSMYSDGVFLSECTTRFRSSPGVVEIDGSIYNSAGTISGARVPPQVSTLIQKRSGLAGRQNRGRMYMPFPDEDGVDDGGFLTTARLNGIQAAATQFLSDLSASSIPMVILHTDGAITPTAVTALEVSPKVATQRRRLR